MSPSGNMNYRIDRQQVTISDLSSIILQTLAIPSVYHVEWQEAMLLLWSISSKSEQMRWLEEFFVIDDSWSILLREHPQRKLRYVAWCFIATVVSVTSMGGTSSVGEYSHYEQAYRFNMRELVYRIGCILKEKFRLPFYVSADCQKYKARILNVTSGQWLGPMGNNPV